MLVFYLRGHTWAMEHPCPLQKDDWPVHSLCPVILGQCLLLQALVAPRLLGYTSSSPGNPTVEPLIRFYMRNGPHLGFDSGRGDSAYKKPKKSSQNHPCQFPKSDHSHPDASKFLGQIFRCQLGISIQRHLLHSLLRFLISAIIRPSL